VTLAEKGNRLGGVLLFAEHDHDKHEWMDFERVLERELAESGATVELGVQVDEEYLRSKKPDYVVLAVGAHCRPCPLPGGERAMDAVETYYHMDQIGHSVVIAGGGLTACETALNLAAAGHEVTVVARKPRITPSTFGYYRNALLDEMDRRKIRQLLSVCPIEFTDEGLVCERATDEKGTPGGARLVIHADTYVYSFGMDSNSEEVERLTRAAESVGAKVVNAGNSKAPGTVRDAVHGGDQAAMSIL
jgi:pyruvate/2-oxoglutarate dehydrogenase complex dihydrolipoamide dehydrogenase (E3) component